MNRFKREILAKAAYKISDAKTDIEGVKDLEEEGYENLSDGLKETEMGVKLEECASALSDICDELDSVIDELNDVIER